jgi:uncharacterized protein (TIGR02453 family)
MSDGFQGWPEEAQRFFIGLQLDNSKKYFDANKDVYQRCVRAPMEAMLAELEPEFGAGKIFRINRDIRFSADKSPYKTQIGATSGSGYVQFSAKGLYAGAGWYQPDKDWLLGYREAVADDRKGPQLARIVAGLEKDGYELWGEDLKVVPRPYPRDHPRGALLRHKHLGVSRDYGLQAWLGTSEARDMVAEVWRAAKPLLAWVKDNVREGSAAHGQA